MKTIIQQIITSVFLLAISFYGNAQTFFAIGEGGNMFIQKNAQVSFDSLVLYANPGNLLLTENSITKSATVRQSLTTGNYISRVYQFDKPVSLSDFDLSISYKDDELNGINENDLVFDAYTSQGWKAFTDFAYDNSPDENYVAIEAPGAFTFDEITLASMNSVLPLQWISLEAIRNNSVSYITWTTAQEINCKYYQVQKSTDTRSWQNVGNAIAAYNSASGFNSYSLSDADFLDGTAYYRIVLTDINGTQSYSTIVSVKVTGDNNIVLYPNPAKDVINVKTGGNNIIRRVKVFDASGKLLMIKEGSNSNVYSFNVSSLASGFYMMTIETTTGKLSKGFIKQ